ncbi:unnamed protein product (macronuclear) [Paramecium tetraurelia]|uniref:Transmembrane protein n=1 Tax=Paramecium tetraurelia TaxID=5888 RepID=A0CGF1_PARTE|nr:uncharacterized protein GSPATT00007308001 [Paramecium tetraurelia]CAK69868.1 unnamed protein product [Paramecium tetraurelia]|eukprot:XP_001437265.1 hypothetical protein (macronuclear) [Paramecium tetraurelia strain d4-2]
MIIFLFYYAYSQFIQEGISILEKGMKISQDRDQIYSNCPKILNSICDNRLPSIQKQDQEIIDFIQLQAQQVLEQLEPEQHTHSYYNKNINKLFQEIVLYDQSEEFLSFKFEFSQFYQKKELQQIQYKYYIDFKNRSAILMNSKNNSLQEFNTTMYMKFSDFYIPSRSNFITQQFGSLNTLYPPDGFNIRTTEQNGSIYFTKPVYLTQFYAFSYNINSIIRINYNNQTIKMVSIPMNKKWILILGPTNQLINNITVDKNIHIDSIAIKVSKQPYTKQQIKALVIEKLLEQYYLLHSESLINTLKIEEDQNSDQPNKQKVVDTTDDLYQQTIKVFLEFLEIILARIKQIKKQKQYESLSSDQIQDILLDIENEMTQNQVLIFQSLFSNFIIEKYNENDIMLMHQKLLQIDKGLQDKKKD